MGVPEPSDSRIQEYMEEIVNNILFCGWFLTNHVPGDFFSSLQKGAGFCHDPAPKTIHFADCGTLFAIQKIQSILAVFSIGLLQMALPQVRKLVDETGMLSSTGFLTKGSYILCPVVDLFAATVATPVSTTGWWSWENSIRS